LSNQVQLHAETRLQHGKGASGRLRKEGKVPAILYGYKVEPQAVTVDALALLASLRTEAGANVLIRLEVDGDTHLTVARDMQRHPVRGDALHVDFIAVDKDSQISVEVPIHFTDEEETAEDDGVVNVILYTVTLLAKPLEVPNYLELSLAGLEIGDVKRVEDLRVLLPEGAEFDIDPQRTVVTINAPVSEAELEALEESAGIEEDEPEVADGEGVAPTDEVPTADDEG
jgi:large subunit ribosomal protein L25